MAESIDPDFLRNSELFESQPAEVIRAVLAQGQLVEFGPGEVVFHQGDQGDRLFVVKSGVLEVLATPSDATDAVPGAYLGTGEVLGELARPRKVERWHEPDFVSVEREMGIEPTTTCLEI